MTGTGTGSRVMDILADWWQFGLAVAGVFIGWLLGQERRRWKQEQLGARVEHIEARIRALEAHMHASNIVDTAVSKDLEQMKLLMTELRDDFRKMLGTQLRSVPMVRKD